jgi:FMNH2-dependent dimethyl sulfone monooxygenase
VNRFFGDNAYKLGLFGANCGGGMTLSSAPERWLAKWDDIAAVYRIADEAGIEFILPIAKWRGLGGEADMWGRSYETFTHGAAAGAITKHIGIFVTAHVPLVTPAFAAKAISTIDHVTHGRAGVNIVCGWNPDEFSLHGVTIDGDRRYDQGLEWYRIYAKIFDGGEPFDWNGEFYKLRGVTTNPLPVQRPRPPVMSAGASGTGRQFAAQAADMLFTASPDLEQTARVVNAVKADAAAHGRETDVYIQTQIICKPSRREADDFYHYFAEQHADHDALAYFRRQRGTTPSRDVKAGELPYATPKRFTMGTEKAYAGLFPGITPLLGSPDDVVDHMRQLNAMGVSGSALVFLNYLDEMPYFVDEVLPRMERAGLRRPFRQQR